jgi:hypothetical protein
VKKVGPPFSQDSPETGKLRDELSKQSSIHLLKYPITNWKGRTRPASLKFLVHKKLVFRMVISLEFKGKSHRYNHFKADLDPTLNRIFFLNQHRVSCSHATEC